MRLRMLDLFEKLSGLLSVVTFVVATFDLTSALAAKSYSTKLAANTSSTSASPSASSSMNSSISASTVSGANVTSGESSTSAVTAKPSEPASASAGDSANVGFARGEATTTIGNSASWRKAKETKFAYKMGSGFSSFANEREQAQFFAFGLRGDAKTQLADSLGFRIKAGAELSSGYAQSRFGDNVGKSGFYVQEAVMNWRLLDTSLARVYVSGGALDQGAFDAPLLVDEQAFPGVKESLVLGSSKEFRIKLWAQQTIPTSKTLSTKTVDAEVTPSFTTETAALEIRPVESLRLNAGVTHFTFNNLPSAVAQESVLYGNSISEIGPNTSRFKFRFDGLLATGEVEFDLMSKLTLVLRGHAIQNAAAEEGYRNAQLLQTGLIVRLPGEVELQPRAAVFFIEDDAAPGFYNSSKVGHTNRKGYAAAIDAFFQRQRFKLKAEYVEADVINFNINQSRQQTFTIGFETFYEML